MDTREAGMTSNTIAVVIPLYKEPYVASGRERLSPQVYRGFFLSIDPQGYLLLLAVSYLPVAVQHMVRQSLLWSRQVLERA
jgi:hypothetical protein